MKKLLVSLFVVFTLVIFSYNFIQINPKVGVNDLKLIPNPFNSTVQILYKNSENVRADVYDLMGHHIAFLESQSSSIEGTLFFWDGNDNDNRICSSGLYFVTLQSDDIFITEKIILAR